MQKNKQVKDTYANSGTEVFVRMVPSVKCTIAKKIVKSTQGMQFVRMKIVRRDINKHANSGWMKDAGKMNFANTYTKTQDQSKECIPEKFT